MMIGLNPVERMEELIKEEKEELETKAMEEDDFVQYEPERAWDVKRNLGQHNSHMTIVLFEKLGKRKFEVDKYGRRIVTNAQIEIHGYKFAMDLVVDEYEGTEEPSVVFGRDFLLATKCTLNFRLGNMQINIEHNPKEHNPPPPPTPTQEEPNSPDSPLLALPNEPLQPLSPMEEAKTIESMDMKYKELLEEKPIFHVLENYTYYRKMSDEVSMDKNILEMKEEIEEEDVAKIIEEVLPKKMDDPRNCIMPLKVNGTTPINALVDTKASVSVMPYKRYK
nr:hypothetical protein [Tanacetum cinerariifolium]